MIVKKHVSGGKLVLAICDSNLKGKVIEEGEKSLDLSSDFYDGKETSEDDLKKLIKSSYILNLVGEESIALARQLINIDSSNVLYIEKVPHAQVLFVSDGI